MLGSQVRIPLHHLRRSPAAKLLQHVEWSTVLGVPAGPGMSQVMPAKTDAYTCTCDGRAPCPSGYLTHRLATVRKHPLGMSSCLSLEYLERILRQRNTDRLLRLGLVRMNPSKPTG